MKFLIAAAASLALTTTAMAAAYRIETLGMAKASTAKSDQTQSIEVAAKEKKPGPSSKPSRPANKKSSYDHS
ncbi:hypothetical protein [Ensifer sp. 4252]|uniref:hypothetical protein n=1 Tax=Ensifer sp. 4252 TaxID=3373915 RepID=UPI003D1E2CA5